MVTQAINMFTGQVFAGILASVGDLGTTDNKKRYYEVFCTGFYINALMFITITVVLWFVISDFIPFLGSDKLLMDNLTLAIILAVFLVNGMRRISITFREAQGLYWYDRYKPIFESVINLVVSIVLAIKIGLPGVFIGTLVSLLTTSFWVEPFVLYKYGFGLKLREYFIKYGYYILVGAISFVVIYFIARGLGWTIPVWTFIAETILYMIVAVGIFVLLTIRTAEVKQTKDILLTMLRRRRADSGGSAE
jgi:hypothetical protein